MPIIAADGARSINLKQTTKPQRRINECEYETTNLRANGDAMRLKDAVHNIGTHSGTGAEDCYYQLECK